MHAIDYDIVHRRLMHESHERVLKACKDAGIKIDPNTAKGYQCHWCYLGKSKQFISHDKFP
ncbi:hypothetical protein C8A05DRAFT_39656 [Staphylotrichum tortipilum]|uniref:GAG-pre-integrase domain-containing protein n=1 Tax=Staphylotrichum tortipilum TaxID=2831512 RepID=A0AAN6RN23_9PEZI|nr:hypothetical protein C8A05DRAFT_39656 [Staphylotrichum longicolle]